MYELYALGVLEPEEEAEINQHLATGCATCRKGVNAAALTNTIVLSFAPDAEPSKRLKRKLMAAVGVEQRQWGWLGWAALAACLLISTLWLSVEERKRGGEVAEARKQVLETNGQLARVQGVLDLLNSPETKQVNFGRGQTQPPKGNVFVNPSSGVLLIASNLPALPVGKTYEMWLIPKGGAPKAAGLFKADARGVGFNLLPGAVDLGTVGTVAVTVEPEAGVSAPTSAPILAAQVSD